MGGWNHWNWIGAKLDAMSFEFIRYGGESVIEFFRIQMFCDQ